jgi:hypothetical protein
LPERHEVRYDVAHREDGGFRVDQELKAYLEGLESRMDERFVRLEVRMDERFEKVETEGRHTRVLLEGLDQKIRLVAEGVAGVSERLEDFKAETARNFTEVKASFATQHRNLKGNVQELENRVQGLSRRVDALEARAASQAGDV